MPHRPSQFTVHRSLLTRGEAHLLLKGTRRGNGTELLWGAVLQQRVEPLAERGPDGGQVPLFEPVHVLREQPGKTGGPEWGGLRGGSG